MKIFKDRSDAALQMVKRLEAFKGKNPLVLGIPRGAMPMAEIIARSLDGELGAVLVHKIPSPDNEEFAVGSVGLSGKIHKNLDLAQHGISESYFNEAARKQLARLKERQKRLHLTSPNCEGRIVILVDDGIATGATAMAAIQELKAMKPKRLVLAAGVVAREAAANLRKLVDEFVALEEPEFFFAVGQFFEDFSEVTDEMVEQIISKDQKRRKRAA